MSYVNGFANGWDAAMDWLAENYPVLDERDDEDASVIDAGRAAAEPYVTAMRMLER